MNNESIYEKYKDVIENSNREIIACRFNNEIKPLDYCPNTEGIPEFITLRERDGKRIYVRGLLYVMAKAFEEIYPESLLTVNYQLSNAMLCHIDNMEVTQEMIDNVNKRMHEIIEKDIQIVKIQMSKENAEEFYKAHHTLKGRLQLSIPKPGDISLYYCEEYFNYFYGAMPISTGYMKVYEISKYGNAILLRYPSRSNPHSLSEFVDHPKLVATLDDYENIHKILNINTVYKLNREIELNRIAGDILIDEALHEKKIASIADDILKRKGVKMILIAGPSSSGKTTFAQKLCIHLKVNGINPITMSVDNYFVERDENPKDENGNYDFECIEAIDLKLFNNHLLKLLNGEEIEVPTFDFTQGSKKYLGNRMKMHDNEILVIEGIHCLNDKLTELIPREYKYKIYISALTVLNLDYHNRISTTDTRLVRRIVRDHQFRGYSALHTLKMWDSVRQGEEKNIFPYQEEADSMFNSSLIYELGVLRDYAMPLLEEIDNSHPEYAEAKRLYSFLNYFKSIPTEDIPSDSLLREFIGGTIFVNPAEKEVSMGENK